MTPSAAGDSRRLKSSHRVQRPQPSRASISGAFAVTSPFPPPATFHRRWDDFTPLWSTCLSPPPPTDGLRYCGVWVQDSRAPQQHKLQGFYCNICKLESTGVRKRRKIKISCLKNMTLHMSWVYSYQSGDGCINLTCSPVLIQLPCVFISGLQPSGQPSHVASKGRVLHEFSSTRLIGSWWQLIPPPLSIHPPASGEQRGCSKPEGRHQ